MLDPDKVDRYLEKNVIEIAPIAFMRGRTLNDAFVILDEAQNTTSEQMKMFVTRLGFNSKAVITGDITQIDLPNASRSGLVEANEILQERRRYSLLLLRRGRCGAASPGAAHHSRLRRSQRTHRAAFVVAGNQERQRLCRRPEAATDGLIPPVSSEKLPLRRAACRRSPRCQRTCKTAFPSKNLVPCYGRAFALPFVLETKVVLLEHQTEGVRERALALFAGKAQRAIGLRGEVVILITTSRECGR